MIPMSSPAVQGGAVAIKGNGDCGYRMNERLNERTLSKCLSI